MTNDQNGAENSTIVCSQLWSQKACVTVSQGQAPKGLQGTVLPALLAPGAPGVPGPVAVSLEPLSPSSHGLSLCLSVSLLCVSLIRKDTC